MSLSETDSQKVLHIWQKYNLDPNLLITNNRALFKFIPKTVLKVIEQIRKNDVEERILLFRFLKENYNPDSQKICYKGLSNLVCETKKDIVHKKYPKLQFSEDGLISFEIGNKICNDGFEHKHHYLIFNDFIRENYDLTSFLFFSWLKGRKKGTSDIIFKALMDPDSLGIKKSFQYYIELAHWQGPKSIEYLQKTHKKHLFSSFGAENSISNNFLDKIDYNFNKSKDGYWKLEIEETIPIRAKRGYTQEIILNDELFQFYTRYAHATVDNNLEKCYHLDLSVRSNNNIMDYSQRTKKYLHEIRRDLKYQKLIRIDSEGGEIPFKDLIGLYFYFSPYVLELFEGKSDFYNEVYPIRERRMEYIIKDLDKQIRSNTES